MKHWLHKHDVNQNPLENWNLYADTALGYSKFQIFYVRLEHTLTGEITSQKMQFNHLESQKTKVFYQSTFSLGVYAPGHQLS